MQEVLVGGKYRLLRELGRGGMGSVHEAIHIATGKRLAVKLMIPPREQGEDSERVLARFQREAMAAGSVDTQHVVQIFDAGPHEEGAYIAMEMLRGEDVKQLIARLGPLRPRLALTIVAQACLGLEPAHRAGVVHRDLKPGNLFLSRTESGEHIVKVLDFGIAKVRGEPIDGDSGTLTQTGTLLGSPHYMSPEQAKGLKTIDARSDIWSMGAVLFKCLTGRTPFDEHSNIGRIIVAICCEEPAEIQSRAPWVPPELAALVHRALGKEPEHRFQSARELLEAIRDIDPDTLRITDDMLMPLSEPELTAAARSRPEVVSGVTPAAMSEAQAFRMDGRPVSSRPSDDSIEKLTKVVPGGARRSQRHAWIAGAILGGAALAGAGGTVLLGKGAATGVGLVSSQASASASSSPDRTPAGTWSLRISPPDATVHVNGEVFAVQDGNVKITGVPGSVHDVRLTLDQRASPFRVVLTERGPLPDALTLASASIPTTPKGTEPKGTAPAAKASVVAAKHETPPGAPTTTTKPKGNDGFDRTFE